MKGTGVFTVEWSNTQGCFHIEPLLDALEINLRSFRENLPLDYIPLGIYESKERAEMACERFHREQRGGKPDAE